MDDIIVIAPIWDAYEIFSRTETQWRTDQGRPTGLDYSAVFALMDVMSVSDKRAMLDDIRIMEAAALKEIRKPT